MSSTTLLGVIPVLILSSALTMLVLAVLTRQKRIALLSAGLILANANWSSVNRITSGAGISTAAIVMGVVFVFLVVCFGLTLFRVPCSLVHGPGILVFLTLYYVGILSPVVSIDPITSVRTSLSFVLVCLVGWYTFGEIFSKHPECARARVLGLMYVVAANNLIILVGAAILMGPSAWHLAIGGLESRIGIGSFTISRLQAEGFNATGLGALAAGALFVIIHWYTKSKGDVPKRALFAILAAFTGVLLLWTGGRSAILAFAGTAGCVSILTSVQNKKKALRKVVILVIAVICIYAFRDVAAGIFWRGPVKARVSKSMVDLFLQSRIETSVSALNHYGGNIVFGNGTGILARSDFNVESFFFRVLIELGVIGGTIYTLTFLSLTYYVFRVDLYYLRLGQPGAWLPSSVFLFAWVISPASYGFSLFTGALTLQIAIAAGAVVEWKRLTRVPSINTGEDS